jgi:3-deoxy-D-manno-octulosonic-acid transferase
VLFDLAYLLALVLATPWLVYRAMTTGRYRRGWNEKFLGRLPVRSAARKCAWFHAVSVGEVNQLAPLLAEFHGRHPDWDVVVTTTTDTGMEVARRRYAEHTVAYLPLDFSWAVSVAFRRLQPNLLVLVELELWPNLLTTARRLGVPVAIVNGRISDRSFRTYQRVQRFLRPWFRGLNLVAAQSSLYAERFQTLGAAPESVRVTGSIKFDGIVTDRHNERTTALRSRLGWPTDVPVFVAGSTQEPEEELAIGVYQRLLGEFPDLRMILVPRHPERGDSIAGFLDASGARWTRRSTWDNKPPMADDRVVLVDIVGELGAWWGLADVAFVGGSLGNRGGQNMIEPAAYGAAICFGPNTWNFRDVVALLLAEQAAVVVPDSAALESFARAMLADPLTRERLGHRAQQLVLRHAGATARTVDLLDRVVANAPTQSGKRVAA